MLTNDRAEFCSRCQGDYFRVLGAYRREPNGDALCHDCRSMGDNAPGTACKGCGQRMGPELSIIGLISFSLEKGFATVGEASPLCVDCQTVAITLIAGRI